MVLLMLVVLVVHHVRVHGALESVGTVGDVVRGIRVKRLGSALLLAGLLLGRCLLLHGDHVGVVAHDDISEGRGDDVEETLAHTGGEDAEGLDLVGAAVVGDRDIVETNAESLGDVRGSGTLGEEGHEAVVGHGHTGHHVHLSLLALASARAGLTNFVSNVALARHISGVSVFKVWWSARIRCSELRVCCAWVRSFALGSG
mmetsp:Transcript_558/g.1421  ORF Transcript_558/g.1421 Transcript_558/m.1421 type:complete len:201 (-) Transcript_558:19-621(-)